LRLEYSSHNPLINSQNLFYDNTTSNVTDVVLDPDKKLPDFNRSNNKMKEKPF